MISTTLARVQSNLNAAGLSASVFAKIAGVPASSLTESFRGARYAGAQEEARWLTLSVRCLELINALRPLTMEKGAWEPLQMLLEVNKQPQEVRRAIGAVFEETVNANVS